MKPHTYTGPLIRCMTMLSMALLIHTAKAQTNPTAQSLPYSQDFSSLAAASTTYPAGWQGWTISTTPGSTFNTTGPTADRVLIASSSASNNTGGLHNYNGKIGFLNSGSLDLTAVLALSTIGNSNVQVAYDIMTIRNPYDGTTNTRINEVTLQYRIGESGAWNNLTGIEYQNNTTAQTGTGVTTPQNLQNKTVTLPLACDDQPIVQVRWASRQVSGGGSRPSFAMDNIVVSGSALSNTTVAFTSASSTVSEGVGTTNLTIAINNPSTTQATQVEVAITAGSAARVNNYTTQTVTFPANDGSSQAVTISVTDDAVYDGGGTVTFTLQNVTGGQGTPAIGAPSSHALTITENEPSPLVINEVDYDNPGADTEEFVEIKNNGLVPIDIAGFKLELVNGNLGGAAVYATITLPSFSLAAGDYYVVGNSATIPNIDLVLTTAAFAPQNGSPDAIGLRDPSNVLVDAVSYEGNTGAPYTEGTGIDIANSDDATAGIGISRFPDGSDTNDNSVDWGRHCLSPGAANLSSSANCICTPPTATATTQCIDDFSWKIVVDVTSTGSGSVVNITNNVNGSSALGVGVGQYDIGPFANNTTVNITVAHQSFTLCDVTINGIFNNCLPDCNNVVGGPDVPGAPCDDNDVNTENDVWSVSCVCAGTPIVPLVSFVLPSSTVNEPDGAVVLGVEMNIAPDAPVVVDVSDLLTGSASSGVDYATFSTQQLTFLPSDTYPYTQVVVLGITDDPDYEPIETVNMGLAISSGTAGIGTGTHTITIFSDDAAPLRINEVDYDNAGTDNAEYVELKNIGNTSIDLSGFKVELVNGNLGGAAVYQTITLPSFSLAAGGYYVVGNNASTPNINLVVTPATNLIQNGSPDAIGLKDPLGNLLDAISYEGNTGAPYTEGTGMSLTDADDNTTTLKVIARYLDGNDTDDNSVDWKVWCATPGASNATVDADGDLIADCLDNCPNLFGQQGDACDDNDACTINDVITNACVCAGTFQDTDGDLTCDANDGCPNDPNKIAPGACGCGVPDSDSDGDTIADCVDNCPNTPGQIGSACNDNNPFTTGDVLQNDCSCAGTPVPCDNWTLTFIQGSDDQDNTWQVIDATSPFVLQSGGPYAAGSVTPVNICVPQGACFRLTVNDLSSNGMTGGGWVLTDNNGRRIVDNSDNGACLSSSSTTGEPWCNQPASAQTVIATHCDRVNWLPGDVIIASADPAVSSQWGIGNQNDDGYQFWFEAPCGGYTRRVLRTHAVSGGNGPANALRATKLALGTIVTNPLPVGTLLNVRVRSLVNGTYGAWGPACLFKIDPAACTLTKLNDVVSDPHYSCGVTGKVVNAGGDVGKLFAKVVTSGGSPATNYRFEIANASQGYVRYATSANAALVLGQWASNPLLCGTWTYDVRVQASFDGGNSYCPFGASCTVSITNNLASPLCTEFNNLQGGSARSILSGTFDMTMYPNPNLNGEVFINLNGFDGSVSTVGIEVYDGLGKRVVQRTLAAQDGTLNATLSLEGSLPSGLYLVQITAGADTRTERLILQR